MKKIILLAAALFVAGNATAQQTPIEGGKNLSYSYENFIQVNGNAERKVVPDEIYVRIVINEQEMKLKKSVEQMEQAMIGALKSIGVDTDKNLTIDRMSSDYKDYFLRPDQARTTATYELKVGSAAELGKAYQVLEKEGISNLTVTRQTHSRIKEIRSEMRIEAMKNAQQTAQELLAAVGQKLGPAVWVNDGGYNGVMYKAVMARGVNYDAVAESAPYETPLQLSDLELTYSVNVKFALQGVDKP